MTPTALTHAEEEFSWDKALILYNERLRCYLDYLIECDCGDGILAKVEAELKGRSAAEKFKFRFMVTVLVRHVMQHVRECPRITNTMDLNPCDSATTLPALERLFCFVVYFLRDILGFSVRDTSLLIGIKDAHVEKLLPVARKRIDLYEGPSSIEIESPTGSYFRWKFDDLHLR